MAIVKRKNKDGSWTYQVKVRDLNGKQISFSFGKQAEATAYQAQLNVNKSISIPLSSPGKKISLNQFCDQWFESSNMSTEGWKSSQKQMYRDYAKPYIGSIPLSKIRPAHISDLLLKMQKIDRSPQTIRHVYNLLHKMFGDCIKHYKYLRENPVSSDFNPKVSQADSNFLYLQEVLKLLKHVRNKPYGLGISIQLIESIRIGEVKYLRWDQIDFHLSEIHIKGTYRKKEKRMVDRPKDGEPTKIKIPKSLLIYLKEEKARKRSDWVQPSEDNPNLPFSETTYGKYLKKYCIEAEVNPKITSHCLRHSIHSLVMAAGGTEEDMQILLRHASPATTQRYLHGGHKPQTRLDEIMAGLDLLDESANHY